MQDDARIEIVVDPSLLDHFRDHMRNRNSSMTPEEAITGLVAMILVYCFAITGSFSGSSDRPSRKAQSRRERPALPARGLQRPNWSIGRALRRARL